GGYRRGVGFVGEGGGFWVPEERGREWSFAAGISLHQTGFADEAQPLLEEAVRTYPPGKHEAALIVTQIYMDGRTPENLEHALALNDQLVADATLRTADRDNAWLQRAQILLAVGRRQESEEAVEKISRDSRRTQGIAVLRAQSMMVDGKFREALKTLDPLSRDVGLDQAYPAQAQYLMGVCAEQLGEIENAVVYY